MLVAKAAPKEEQTGAPGLKELGEQEELEAGRGWVGSVLICVQPVEVLVDTETKEAWVEVYDQA